MRIRARIGNKEFIASVAEAGGGTKIVDQYFSEFLQDDVSDLMAVHIVEELEVIDIDHRNDHIPMKEVLRFLLQGIFVLQPRHFMMLAFLSDGNIVLQIRIAETEYEKNGADDATVGDKKVHDVDGKDIR